MYGCMAPRTARTPLTTLQPSVTLLPTYILLIRGFFALVKLSWLFKHAKTLAQPPRLTPEAHPILISSLITNPTPAKSHQPPLSNVCLCALHARLIAIKAK